MREVGCALIWNEKGQLLIAQRKIGDSFGGFWEFPGGKRNQGETLEQCTAREIKEELGVNISVGKLVYEMPTQSQDGQGFKLYFFECRYISGEIQKLDVADWAWVVPQNLKKFKFLPANDVLIEKIIGSNLNFNR